MISKIKSMVLTLLLIVAGASHAAGVSNSPPSRTQSTVSIGAPSAPATGIDYRAINLGGWSTLYGYNGDTLGNVSAVSLGVNVNRGAFPSIPTYRSTGWATNFFMQSNESGNPQISLGVYPSGAAGAGLAAATSRLTLTTGSINLEGTVNVATNAVVNGSLDTWGFANLNGGTITTTLTASLAAGLNGGVTTTTLAASGAITSAGNAVRHNGNIFHGRLASNAAVKRLPGGWTASFVSTGAYDVTHNLGLANNTYTLTLSPSGDNAISNTFSWLPVNTNTFRLFIYSSSTGTPVNGDVSFLMTLD